MITVGPGGRAASQLRERMSHAGKDGLTPDTGWAMGLEVVGLLTSLLAFALLGRALGAEGYGNFAALYAVIWPLSAMASSGVGLTLLDHVVRDREDLERTFRSCLGMTLVFGTLLLVAGTAVTSLIVDLKLVTIASVFAIEMITFPAFLVATNVVFARDGFAAAARFRVLYQLARAVVLVALFATGSLTIASFGAANLAVTGVLAAGAIRTVRASYGIGTAPGRIVGRHVRTSAIYSAGITGLALQTDGDKLLLASYGQTVATGLYSAAYRVVMLGLVPVNAVVQATHLRFLDHDGDGHSVFLRRALGFSVLATLYGAVVGTALVALAPLLPYLVGSDFDGSVEIVRWLAPLVIIRGVTIFPLNGLMGLGKTLLRTMLLLGSSVLSIGIYVALIPTYSWKGAAIGTIVGELALAVAAWVLLVRFVRAQAPVAEQLADSEPAGSL